MRLRAGLPEPLPERLAVAVSGGSDSVGLLYLLAKLPDVPSLSVVTVNHGLRPEAAAEAEFVSHICAKLKLPHDVLHWSAGPKGGNLQAEAREARYDLMADWAQSHGVTTLVLGHTQDDQAETVLMRLMRGAGVTGLAGMRPFREDRGVTWLRPLLGVSRAELRAYLGELGVTWCDDPSNEDSRFERVQTRQLMANLDLPTSRLAEVACHMARAEDALHHQTEQTAGRIGQSHLGDVLLDPVELAKLPEEIARRLLLRALSCVGGGGYAPRSGPVMRLLHDIWAGQGGTLAGCRLFQDGSRMRVTREFAAIADLRTLGPIWDRWRITDLAVDEEIAALGEGGLTHLPDWRKAGAPRASLIVSPAVWRRDDLVAAPLAGWENGRPAMLLPDRDWTATH